MKPRMGMNAIFVRLLARESRKVVAAETGVSKDSYSSRGGVIRHRPVIWMSVLAYREPNIFYGVGVPLFLSRGIEAKLGEDVV